MFWNCANGATKALLLDPYLQAEQMAAIRDQLWNSTDIERLHIITEKKKDWPDTQSHLADLRRRLLANNPTADIQLKGGLDGRSFPFLHDRFAMLDGELWHFGGTVGGLQNGLTAYSRGWSASAQQFEKLFSEIWNNLKD